MKPKLKKYLGNVKLKRIVVLAFILAIILGFSKANEVEITNQVLAYDYLANNQEIEPNEFIEYLHSIDVNATMNTKNSNTFIYIDEGKVFEVNQNKINLNQNYEYVEHIKKATALKNEQVRATDIEYENDSKVLYYGNIYQKQYEQDDLAQKIFYAIPEKVLDFFDIKEIESVEFYTNDSFDFLYVAGLTLIFTCFGFIIATLICLIKRRKNPR